MNEPRRLAGAADVIVFLMMAPLAALGILWLAALTDLAVIRDNWPALILLGALLVLFARVSYFLIIEIHSDRYGSADGSFADMVQWSAILLFGPTALWLSVLWSWSSFLWNLRAVYSPAGRWSQLRGFSVDQATNLLGFLAGLSLYRQWGGTFPIEGLNLSAVITAMGAIAVHLVGVILILSAYIASIVWVQFALEKSTPVEILVKFVLLAVVLPFLAYPFGILAAGLYVQNGIGLYLFLMFGLLLVATMARRLSWAVEASRQQSRQLQKLEHLGRDLLTSPPDASNLAGLLEAHVPTMFPPGRVVIWLAPDQALFQNPADWSLQLLPIWKWVQEQPNAQAFLAEDVLPWDSSDRNAGEHDPIVIAPMLSNETASPIGSVYLQLRSLSQPWDRQALSRLFPAVHSLAAQIASALHQAQVYAETLEYQQAAQELAFAGRIQASFLPSEIPNLDGWELAVTLLPARETSGDFFDFIPLPDGRIGFLIADVADKGVGAALYMALCRTLIRTYALEYDTQPDIVILAANERILEDARANLFITAFYGILDGATCTLTYCNAGHNSPYLFNSKDGGIVRALGTTGMPMGIERDAVWGLATIQIEPGDVIVLYTDGIPDAMNSEGEFFGKKQLVEVARGCLGLPAQEIQNCILEAVQTFAGNTPQFDDITLLVMLRNEAQPAAN